MIFIRFFLSMPINKKVYEVGKQWAIFFVQVLYSYEIQKIQVIHVIFIYEYCILMKYITYNLIQVVHVTFTYECCIHVHVWFVHAYRLYTSELVFCARIYKFTIINREFDFFLFWKEEIIRKSDYKKWFVVIANICITWYYKVIYKDIPVFI